MRKSRLSLTYPTSSAGILGWVAILAAIVVGIYLSFEHLFPFFGLVGLFLIWVSIENARLEYAVNKLILDRAGESFFTFSKNADLQGLDMNVVKVAYDEIQLFLCEVGPKVPLRWSDSFKKDLKIDGIDLEEVIAVAIARRTGRRLVGTPANPYYDKIVTVGDLILFFNLQPIEIKI